MAYTDLREYLDKLEDEGELKRVSAEVDWNLEVGAIASRVIELREPGVLFEKIKGYPEGYRILGNPMGPSKPNLHARLALAINLPKEVPTLELIREFRQRTKKTIEPRIVKSGPCKENIDIGDDVNILKFPVPFIHEMDGNRFIGTWHINVTKDPDTGWVNWGMYRMMVHDEKTTGLLWCTPIRHGASHYAKYEAMGKPMPMAVAIGTEPVSTIIAGSPFPYGASEAAIAGGIRGEPVELIKCETVDLEVPATSEIVLEGEIAAGERRMEGPFGEYTGYCAGEVEPRPVFHIKCVTYREKPILSMCNHQKGYADGAVMASVVFSAAMADDLERRGVPFKNVYNPGASQMTIVSAKSYYPGLAHFIGSTIWSGPHGAPRNYIIVVGEDVDVTNMEDVLWCIGTRCNPGKRIYIEADVPMDSLTPFLEPAERKKKAGYRALFDATFPAEWPEEQVPRIISFDKAWPREVQKKVLRRWEEYFK